LKHNGPRSYSLYSLHRKSYLEGVGIECVIGLRRQLALQTLAWRIDALLYHCPRDNIYRFRTIRIQFDNKSTTSGVSLFNRPVQWIQRWLGQMNRAQQIDFDRIRLYKECFWHREAVKKAGEAAGLEEVSEACSDL
jgi:hypothetical protein